MERDEPTVAYEVAWVDNGSGPRAASLAQAWDDDAAGGNDDQAGEFGRSGGGSGTGGGSRGLSKSRSRSRRLEHVVLSGANHGLAWGLNQLFFDQCTAPYVLILEEDWM